MSKDYTSFFMWREMLEKIPFGSRITVGSTNEYLAAKAHIAALLMSRELQGKGSKEIEEKICKIVEAEPLGIRSAESVLGIRAGATMDYNTCQLIQESSPDIFRELKAMTEKL